MGERAEQPKVQAMRSIVGMAAEGGTATVSALLKQTLAGSFRPWSALSHATASLQFGTVDRDVLVADIFPQ